MWGVVSFKKYNVLCLLREIVHIRMNSLSKGELMFITTVNCIFSVYFLKDIVQAVMLIVSNYSNVQRISNIHIIILLTIQSAVHLCIVWMLLWNISVLICLVSLIISREFNECTRDFELGLDEDGHFPCKLYYETVDRFRQLTLVVNKVDEMFSAFVGIILASTFSLICGSTYYVVELLREKLLKGSTLFSCTAS